jgi:hypothetical protein
MFSGIRMRKHARSKCVAAPLLRAGFRIIPENFLLPAYKSFQVSLGAYIIHVGYDYVYKLGSPRLMRTSKKPDNSGGV